MISDLDVYRVANLMIRKYGADALEVAEQRAAELADASDWEGHATWKRVSRATGDLLREEPDGQVH